MNARSDGLPQIRFRRYPYGVTYRPQHSRIRPWIVKFKLNKRTVHVGCYSTLEQATLAAEEFQRNKFDVHAQLPSRIL